jgi:tetratricopeptide (TPR) repeat protein
MSISPFNLKPIVAATLAIMSISLPVGAQEGGLDSLFERLKSADAVDAARIEREIELIWTQSGSAAMDLLLKRGRDAMEAEDYAAAIEHFTALTDHAPEFPEGWYGRAQAYAFTGRIGPAVEDLNRALALNPRHFDAIFGLGTIFEQLDQPDRAFDAYELVLGLHPHHEEARARLKGLERGVNGFEL